MGSYQRNSKLMGNRSTVLSNILQFRKKCDRNYKLSAILQTCLKTTFFSFIDNFSRFKHLMTCNTFFLKFLKVVSVGESKGIRANWVKFLLKTDQVFLREIYDTYYINTLRFLKTLQETNKYLTYRVTLTHYAPIRIGIAFMSRCTIVEPHKRYLESSFPPRLCILFKVRRVSD